MSTPSPLRPSPDELRRLYLDEGLSSLVIAERCQVEKISVLRWLKAAGIDRRPIGNGLANRGVTAPTVEDLQDLIHVQGMTYRQVAARYGVDFTAVPFWLDGHGIPRPDPKRTWRQRSTEPSEQELRDRVGRGESLTSIAKDFTVSRSHLGNRCRQYGITVQRDGWQGGKRFTCLDGHMARSTYELRIDDWLSQRHIPHEVEPTYPWDRRYRADFRVGDTFIEVWGVTDNPAYTQRRRMKVERCRVEGIDLIEIGGWQFANGRQWWRRLKRLENTLSDVPESLF